MLPERILPVAERKGKRPSFTLEDILLNETSTRRFDCSFEEIQHFLEKESQQRIPKDLAGPLRTMERWQLVIPTTIDAAQLLFLGRNKDDRKQIPLADAQATVFVHRGAEGGSWSHPRGKYSVTWVELAGIFPDSNGDNRIIGAFYGADEPMKATHVHCSIADDEYDRTMTIMDYFLPVLVEIPTRYSVPNTVGLITQGMIDTLLEPHHRVLSLFPKSTLKLYQIGGRIDEDIDFDQGMSLQVRNDVVEFGLVAPQGERKPWTMSIPERLEKVT